MIPSVRFLGCILLAMTWLAVGHAKEEPVIEISAPKTLGGPAWRASVELPWFPDGNIGALKRGSCTFLYAANGPQPVRLTIGKNGLLVAVKPVKIEGITQKYHYLSGGPTYRDSVSGRVLLFYHAEIHRGSSKDFSSVLGLAIQVDAEGLRFRDAGLIFRTSAECKAGAFDVGGAPVVVRGEEFYVYARDLSAAGHVNNLVVLRAPVKEVVAAAAKGRSADWQKYHDGAFSEPGLGGKSSPLEKGNPPVRWMDVSFQRTLGLYLLVVAAPSGRGMALFISWSRDGIHWSRRVRLTDHQGGECFYPSIISSPLRECGRDFLLDYTYSRKGEWNRWSDAQWLRRIVRITGAIRE